jgi:hypothetical protein
VVKRVQLKNNSNGVVVVTTSILQPIDSPFYLDPLLEFLELQPNEQSHVDIIFSPTKVAPFLSGLVLESKTSNDKYKITLLGYGGSSRMEVVQPASHVVDMGTVYENSPKNFLFSMRNAGSRTGFVKILGYIGEDRVQIEPEAVCVRPGTSQDFVITFSPQYGDSKTENWASPHLTLEVFVGDEIIRRRLRKIRSPEVTVSIVPPD